MKSSQKQKQRKPVFIDLFAGAGGLSIGLEQAGFEPIAALDWDHWSCETLRANNPNLTVHEGDISEFDIKAFEKESGVQEVDLIVGGPPCQGFSQLGKRLKDDPRNQLWRQYMKFVAHFRPKLFVMENVPQLLKSEEYVQIKKMAEKLGYEVKEKVLHAVEYGVPQKRKRAIIMGSRIGMPEHPAPTHGENKTFDLFSHKLESYRTVKDAIGDLPLKPTGKDLHIGRNPTALSLQRYKAVPPGGNRFDLPKELLPACWANKPTGSTDVFGRLEWGKPSLTIRTEFFKPEKGTSLHPKAHRPITLREAARLQTFPDDYVFVGSHVQVAKQIGNAVPCELARQIGIKLLELLDPMPESVEEKVIYRTPSFSRQTAQFGT